MTQAGPPSKLRILNDQAALAFILDAGSVSRAELGRLTGLSKPGVAELLSRLEAAGLVEKAGVQAGGPGPSAQTWRLRRGVGQCAAVDVTPDGWALRILDLDGTPLLEAEGPWREEPIADVLSTAVTSALSAEHLRDEKLMGVAVGVPGAVDPRTGIIRGAPHLPGLMGYDLAGVLSQRLGVPVSVENDVNLMALAAIDDGLAAGAESFVFVWIDEGFGAAVVRNGELIRGFTGGSGEIDYLRVADTNEERAGYGTKLGALLSPASLLALVEQAAPGRRNLGEAMSSPVPPGLAGELVRRVAVGLTAIVAVLDPELILLGGTIGEAVSTALSGPIRDELARLLETDLSFVPTVRSYVVKADAALAGAERVALRDGRGRAFRSGSIVPPLPLDPPTTEQRDHRH